MAINNPRPQSGQLGIEGIGKDIPLEPNRDDNTRMRAFGGFIKSEIYDVFGELPITELTSAEIDWFTPRRLEQVCMVSREDEERFSEPERFNGVLLSPHERTTIIYSPKSLGNRALARTLNASSEMDEETVEKGRRSSSHAVEAKLEKMQIHVDNLTKRRSDIIELHTEARRPGYAHKPKERMQQLFSASWQELLNLADILQEKRNYTDEKKQRFMAAAVNYLTTGPQPERVKKWKKLLEFQKRYLDARISVFENRISHAIPLIENTESEEV